jgi:ribosomal protein S11
MLVVKTLAGLIRSHGLARVDAVFTERQVTLSAIPHHMHPIIGRRREAAMDALQAQGVASVSMDEVTDILQKAQREPVCVISHPDMDAAVAELGRALRRHDVDHPR